MTKLTVIYIQWMNWGIFDIHSTIVFFACKHLLYCTAVLSEIHILSPLENQTWINQLYCIGE